MERISIGEVSTVRSGFAFKSRDWLDAGVSVIKIGNIKAGWVTLDGCSFVSEEVAKEAAAFELCPGDVLISMTGHIGEVARVRSERRMLLNQRVGRFIVRDAARLNMEFLYYCLQEPELKASMAAHAYGVAQPNISPSLIEQQTIPLPPLSVQRRIAGTLSAYDELIENNQRRIQILETMARALYREWFVEFRFPGSDKIPRVASPLGDIPQGWEIVAFTEIAGVLSGGTPKTAVAEYWNGNIPFFTPRDAPACFYVQDTDKHITRLGLSKCASELYAPDTVLITARGTVGKVALPSVSMAMNQSCYALRGKAGIPQRFLFLMTLQQVDYLQTNTGGATFDTIVVDTFRQMKVVKPAHEVIASFARQIDAIFEHVDTIQRQIKNLRRTRDLLLPRLLSGQVALAETAA